MPLTLMDNATARACDTDTILAKPGKNINLAFPFGVSQEPILTNRATGESDRRSKAPRPRAPRKSGR